MTGARGFLGTNFRRHVEGAGVHSIVELTRSDNWADVGDRIRLADFVFHFAGVNRVERESEYADGNVRLTERLCAALTADGRAVPVLLASSAQVASERNAYARSKREAESVIRIYAASSGAQAWVSRLPNLFGPWGRPNYNSVVATFCFNVSRGRPIMVNDPSRELVLADVGDAVACLLACVDAGVRGRGAGGGDARVVEVRPTYSIRLDHLAALIRSFGEDRASAPDAVVGDELAAKLLATYRWYESNGHVFDA